MSKSSEGLDAEVHSAGLHLPYVDLVDVERPSQVGLRPSPGLSHFADTPSHVGEEEVFRTLALHTRTVAKPGPNE